MTRGKAVTLRTGQCTSPFGSAISHEASRACARGVAIARGRDSHSFAFQKRDSPTPGTKRSFHRSSGHNTNIVSMSSLAAITQQQTSALASVIAERNAIMAMRSKSIEQRRPRNGDQQREDDEAASRRKNRPSTATARGGGGGDDEEEEVRGGKSQPNKRRDSAAAAASGDDERRGKFRTVYQLARGTELFTSITQFSHVCTPIAGKSGKNATPQALDRKSSSAAGNAPVTPNMVSITPKQAARASAAAAAAAADEASQRHAGDVSTLFAGGNGKAMAVSAEDEKRAADSSLEQYIQSFKVKYDRLQQQADEKAKASAARTRDLENENVVLTQQVQRLTQQAREAEHLRVKLRDEFSNSERQLSAILSTKEKQFQSDAEVHELEMRKIKAFVQKLQDERIGSQRKINEQETAVKSLQATVLELQTEVDNKKSTLAAYDDQMKGVFTQVRQFEKQLKVAQGSVEVLERHNQDLIEDAARLDARTQTLEARLAEQTNAYKLQSSRAENAFLEQTNEAQASVAEKTAKLEALQSEVNKLEQRLEDTEKARHSMRAQVQALEENERRIDLAKIKLEKTLKAQAEELDSLKERFSALSEERELALLVEEEQQLELQASRFKLDTYKTIYAMKVEQFQSMSINADEVLERVIELMQRIEQNPASANSTVQDAATTLDALGAIRAGMSKQSRLVTQLSSLGAAGVEDAASSASSASGNAPSDRSKSDRRAMLQARAQVRARGGVVGPIPDGSAMSALSASFAAAQSASASASASASESNFAGAGASSPSLSASLPPLSSTTALSAASIEKGLMSAAVAAAEAASRAVAETDQRRPAQAAATAKRLASETAAVSEAKLNMGAQTGCTPF